MKPSRQQKILEIIQKQDIENQNQLVEVLKEEGYKSTQATISRDIREMGLIKELSPSCVYRYAAVNREERAILQERLKTIFQKSITSFAYAQNIVVLKTLPGLAPAAGTTLDSMVIDGLVGCLSGDDTVFLAMKDSESAAAFCDEIKDLL